MYPASESARRFNYPFILVLLVLHIGALGAFKTLSLRNFTLFIVLLPMGFATATIGYHRLLSHRSFQVPKPLLWLIAASGILFLQGRPLQWAITHRKHHSHSDRDGDPHNARLGFWHAHWFWLIRVDPKMCDPSDAERFAPDLMSDFILRFLDRWQLQPLAVVSVIGVLFWFGGIEFVIWGVFVRMVFSEHLTYMVNSVCHHFGYRNYDTKDLSRNNLLLSLFTLGEGWHNNHHALPSSANFGRGWREPDPAYWLICALKALGLASEPLKNKGVSTD